MLKKLLVLMAVLAALPLLALPARGAPGGGTGDGNPSEDPDTTSPPVTSDDGGGFGGTTPGTPGYDDGEETDPDGCGPYTPLVPTSAIEALHAISSTDGSSTGVGPYIQDRDWAAYRANPNGTWYVCTSYITGTPRQYFDYIGNAIPAINFGDLLTPPQVVLLPPADRAVVELDTWVALSGQAGVNGYANMPVAEAIGAFDWEARPRRIVWTPGDGSDERVCEIPDDPRPAANQVPSERDEGCRYTYPRPSVGQPDSAFPAQVQVEYEIYVRPAPNGAWELAAGDNPILGQPADVPVQVAELQAVAD